MKPDYKSKKRRKGILKKKGPNRVTTLRTVTTGTPLPCQSHVVRLIKRVQNLAR
jgi:hypothetical protein